MLNTFRKIKRILLSSESIAPITTKSGQFNCPVCNSIGIGMYPLPSYYISKFHEHQTIHNIFLFETINFENYSCMNCGASDRDRLYALFLRDYFGDNSSKLILDIAPAPALSTFIKSYKNIEYRSMDLYMEGVDDNLDITDMHAYNDDKFDLFMCSHVLEHIPDDLKAMKELYRVLKPGGKGIAMVPINLGIEKTFEDLSLTGIADRWKYFGQDDHVRQYSKADFIHRLTSVGFKIEFLDINYFGEDTFKQNAIFPTSVLYVVSK